MLILSYYKELKTLLPREFNYVIPRGNKSNLNDLLSFLLKSHSNSALCIDDLMSEDLNELLNNELDEVYLSVSIKDYNDYLKHPIYAQHLKNFNIIFLNSQKVYKIKAIDTILISGELKIQEIVEYTYNV